MEISRQGAKYSSNQFSWVECESRKRIISALELFPVTRSRDALACATMAVMFCHSKTVPELGCWSEAVSGNLLASRDLNFSWFL